MEYALLALGGPSNIEKKVREAQSALYRQEGLTSALSLPVVIPLFFLPPAAIPAEVSTLRDTLRDAVGKEAPYLTTKTVSEYGGFLFWELAPRRVLQRLQQRCERVFAPSAVAAEQPPQAGRPELFPVARGFFLCSLQGRPGNSIQPLDLPDSLVFPAGKAFVLRFRTLTTAGGTEEQIAWWNSLFWERSEALPLRKPGTIPGTRAG
jgi:hypothetical protein